MSAEVSNWQTPPAWCATTAKALAIIHFLTIAATAYQDRVYPIKRKLGPFSEAEIVSIWDLEFVVIVSLTIWLSILLSPGLIPLIFRKSGEIVMLCVIPILGLFGARAYYLFQSEWFGVNSLSGKGIDVAFIWLLPICAVSALIVIGWIAACAVVYISASIDALRSSHRP